MVRIRAWAFIALLALLTASCGARLSEDERSAAISTGGGGGSETGSGGGDLAAGEAGSTGGDTSGGDTSGGGSGGGDGGEGGGGGDVSGAGAGGADPAQAPKAPAGGNGGATDVGVTGTEIVIANISDITGPAPGLFKSAQQATQAYVNYQNSKGGINGRLLKLLPLDSKTDAGDNRSRVVDSCKRAFALVGSMSALDNGGAAEVDKCGIPDISAIPVNPQRQSAKNVYSPFPNSDKFFLMGPAHYIKKKYPDVIKDAAMVYVDGAVTQNQGKNQIRAYESIGFEFTMEEKYNVVEANFTPYVLKMKARGIKYITAVADYQSLVRLQQAMRQQNYVPKVRDWNSVVYDPGYIKQGGAAVQKSLFNVSTALIEEADGNPEMKLYLQWLEKTSPGAKPTYFGIYAWSAGRLFVEAATAAGPKLTRQGVFAALQKMHKYNGNGIHVVQDVGAKTPGNCFVYATVSGDSFKRVDPAKDFLCQGELFKL